MEGALDRRKVHSIAEDARDIVGLLATLTEDCVYEVVPTGTVWRGDAGATCTAVRREHVGGAAETTSR